LSSTANGCTVAAWAPSKALATACACAAAALAWVAAVFRKLAYGAAAAVIADEAAPCQAWPARFEVTEPNEEAAELSSEDNPSQAAAAASIGAEPAPENIRAELISGGITKKLMAADLLPLSPARPRRALTNDVVTSRRGRRSLWHRHYDYSGATAPLRINPSRAVDDGVRVNAISVYIARYPTTKGSGKAVVTEDGAGLRR
jgi:hypothetical protein